ncbi:hypothetical protein [Planktothrix agardhii]|uniref:hypothetical protein n=1 Tax=Planktothrix agardhii TaxID=1160 RepID=UPI0020A81764|nr:hypothetical protein [Planktothrix agardhii]
MKREFLVNNICGLIVDAESDCFWRVETGISGLIISVGLIVDTDSVWGRLSTVESGCFEELKREFLG